MIPEKTIRLRCDETQKVTNNWTAEAAKRGGTVSSSTWSASAGSTASAALSGAIASVLLTEGGCGTLTNTVVLSTGETLVCKRRITTDGSAD
jgi:hypothetical protein